MFYLLLTKLFHSSTDKILFFFEEKADVLGDTPL